MRRSRGPILASRVSGPTSLDIDDYSADLPIFAYSLRLISSSYAGNLIKLRRSSDNATSDFGPSGGLGSFVDWTAITTWRDAAGAASAYIDTWYDQTGNGYHLSQATLAEQPLLSFTSPPLGLTACIYFDGVNDTLYHDAGTDDFCNNQMTSYTCYRPVGNTFSSMQVIQAAPAAPLTAHFRTNRYSTQKRTYWNNVQANSASIGTTGNNEHCIDYWNGTNVGYNIDDGTYTGTGATSGNNNEQLILIGGSATGGSNPYTGWMAEWIWFDSYQSSGTQDAIRDEQNGVYSMF